MCNFGCKGNKTFAKSQIIPVICLFRQLKMLLTSVLFLPLPSIQAVPRCHNPHSGERSDCFLLRRWSKGYCSMPDGRQRRSRGGRNAPHRRMWCMSPCGPASDSSVSGRKPPTGASVLGLSPYGADIPANIATVGMAVRPCFDVDDSRRVES